MASGSIPRLQLFSTSRWDKSTTAKRINADAFSTRGNAVGSGYNVNTGAASTPNQFYALNSQYGLTASSELASPYNGQLSLANNTGRLDNATNVGSTPDIPSRYRDQLSNYAVTDADFNRLMAQNEFLIPGVGYGVRVTTDGNGNVASTGLAPASNNLLTSYSALPELNRTDITTGAIFKVDPTDSPYANGTSPTRLNNNPTTVNPNTALNNLGAINTQRPQSVLNVGQKANVGLSDRFGDLSLNSLDRNPLLARLNQFNPNAQGLAVTGQEAELNTGQAQQLASVQAGYGVPISDTLRQNVAQMVTTARMQQSYASTYQTQRLDQVMDGRMPFGPYMNSQSASNNLSASGLYRIAMDAIFGTEPLADATSRRQSGGYLPFRFGGGNSGDMGSGAGNAGTGSNQKPFQDAFASSSNANSNQSGTFQQGTPQRRKPWAMTA